MKFPILSTGGTAPSGNSVALVAVTYPGVRGSRVGVGGRGACVAGGAAGGGTPCGTP